MPENHFNHRRKITFADADMAGIAHFSRILTHVEEAEHALFESAGVPRFTADVCWPRVRVEADYRNPLRFDETAIITLRLQTRGKSSLAVRFQIHRESDGALCAEGGFIIVHATPDGRGMRAAAIPPDWLERLAPYISE